MEQAGPDAGRQVLNEVVRNPAPVPGPGGAATLSRGTQGVSPPKFLGKVAALAAEVGLHLSHADTLRMKAESSTKLEADRCR